MFSVISTHGCKYLLTPEELKTVKNSVTPCMIVTPNGTVETNEEATVYIKGLDIFVCIKSVDGLPAILLVGILRETKGFSYS